MPFLLPITSWRFYELCSGAILFAEADGLRGSGPNELVAAAPRLLTVENAGRLAPEEPDGSASSCFVFADQSWMSTDENIVVDLHAET